ncbi:hypothetical protein [Actinoplanes missouriensis]
MALALIHAGVALALIHAGVALALIHAAASAGDSPAIVALPRTPEQR